LVQAINTHFEGALTALRAILILYILKPLQLFLLNLPFSVAILTATLASFLTGGFRLAARCAVVLLANAVTGWWDRAMISLHLVVAAAFVAALLGVPIGLLPGLWPRSYRAVCLCTDVLLTLPSFVYLIPAVMLFSVGDVPALFAIVAFAIAPIMRYTADGIVNAPLETIEAAEMMGTSAMQRLVAVRLPLALPQMILGLSQTLLQYAGNNVARRHSWSRGGGAQRPRPHQVRRGHGRRIGAVGSGDCPRPPGTGGESHARPAARTRRRRSLAARHSRERRCEVFAPPRIRSAVSAHGAAQHRGTVQPCAWCAPTRTCPWLPLLRQAQSSWILGLTLRTP
jgi:ABC-type proline/glycine betaine transport system permease subunit